MVKLSPLTPYIPINPEEFCTNPYDVISKEEEIILKKNPNSLIHLILPDGEGDEIYQNGKKAYEDFKNKKLIEKVSAPSIFVYRQESTQFSHQGLIVGIALQDYEDGNIVKHEYTRQKPLEDRTNHIMTTKVSVGLVWTVFQNNNHIKNLIEQIKKKEPRLRFKKYGYENILWQETDTNTIQKLIDLFKNEKVYIADGHHRAASAAEYRKYQVNNLKSNKEVYAPWQYLLSYIASDDQIRILPYNRVIKKLSLSDNDFLNKLKQIFKVKSKKKAFNPKRKNEIAIYLKGHWYQLKIRTKKFESKRDTLDVAILQDKILEPILGINDPRSDENIFFVGGVQDPQEMEKYVTEKGNDLVFNLYPVNIKDLEVISDSGQVMPPKSTWFDPKLLSGLVLHNLAG
jgi:uncharacterized protein (DUF1015 family)